VRIDDIARVRLGSFIRPGSETVDGTARVEAVYGYLIRAPQVTILVDTGLGDAGAEVDAHYRPRRIPIEQALRSVDAEVGSIDMVVNCHLHFDHIGNNPRFAGRPVFCQRRELDAAGTEDYTVPELVDFAGATYELLDGEAEVRPGIHVIPTPGHVDGHQSVVVQCDDGSIVLAGQAHDTASQWSADALAAQAEALGHEPPLPPSSPWMPRILAFDPKRVVFAHDAAVWQP
jgi:N-acyl homoserine lactone hydrolase